MNRRCRRKSAGNAFRFLWEKNWIQQTSSHEAQYAAKAKGADIVKQWDAVLDGRTRDSHRRVDGEIRELDEKFSNGLMFPGDPSGSAAEVVNCRCTANTRARWALDEEELETLKERAAFFGLDKTRDFEDFKKKYIVTTEKIQTGGQVKDFWQRQEAKDSKAATEYERIKKAKDVAAVAMSSGMSKEDVETIKNHVFFNVHELFYPQLGVKLCSMAGGGVSKNI